MTSTVTEVTRRVIESSTNSTTLQAIVIFLLICTLTTRELIRANAPHSTALPLLDGVALPLAIESGLIVTVRLVSLIVR